MGLVFGALDRHSGPPADRQDGVGSAQRIPVTKRRTKVLRASSSRAQLAQGKRLLALRVAACAALTNCKLSVEGRQPGFGCLGFPTAEEGYDAMVTISVGLGGWPFRVDAADDVSRIPDKKYSP